MSNLAARWEGTKLLRACRKARPSAAVHTRVQSVSAVLGTVNPLMAAAEGSLRVVQVPPL